ncbi:MAG: putative repeat protein (TIGR01451 family), partial [Myxococcota bacterium]
AATALLIRASLPDGATLVSRSGRGADQASEALAWTGEALPPGQRATFGYVLGLPECYPAGQTDLPITASAECRDTGAVATALASIRVLAAPQLTLKASVEPRRAVPGDVVRAVVATGNVGNAVGTGAVMVVSVPAGTRPLEISRGGRHDQAAGLVSWELEPLPITGEEQACSISLALDSSFDPGATELAVRATVTSAASVAEAETGFVVDAAPEADISLVSDRAEPSPSEPVQYTLRVANNGTAPVQVVELIDPLPLRCSFVSATHGGSYDSGGNSARWLLGPIAAGASIEVMLTVRLDREFPLGLSVVGNQATVRFDDLSVVDSLEHQLEVTAVPVLTPAVQCVTLDAHPGQEVVLTVACEAGGHAPAESTRLRLQLPDCMTPLPARSLSDGVVDAVARTVDWTLGTVSPGTRTEAVVTVLLDPVMPAGDTAHEVTVCVTSDHTEPAEVSTAVVVEAAPRLELSLAFGAEQVSPGELIPLTLAVVNVGDAASARVVVSVPLPEAFEAPEEPGSDTLTWEVGPLDGGGASARRVVSVSPRYEFPVGITRVAISGAATVEDGTVSGCAPATLDVLAEPGLSIGCDVSQQEVSVGERVSTTFEVRNVGHVPLDAVQLRDVLPPGLRAVGAGGDARVVAHEPDGVHWEIDRLPRGKSSILTLAVVPEPGFAHGQTTISHGLVITAPVLAAAVESAPVTLVVNAEATLAGSCIVATSSGAAADGVVAVSPGQRLAVSWQLSNTGTGSAPAGTFEVMLPDGLVPEQVGAEGQVSEAGAITWPVEPPAPGDRLVLQASLRVTRDFPRGATRLSLGGVFTGAGPVVAVQPALLDVVAEPRVEAATLMDRRVYAPGASLAFSLRLANHGTASADALTISVRPDPRVTPVWVEGGRLDEITGAVCWDVPELLADGEPIELRWDGRLSTAFAVGDSVLSQPIEIVGAPLELAPTSWTVRAEQPVAASVDIDPAVAEPGDRVRILVRVGTTGRQVPADVSIQLPDGLHAVEDTLRQVIAGPEETTTTFDAVVQSSLPSGNTSLPVGVTIDAGATQLQHSLELLARVAPELAVSAVVIGALPTAPGQTLSLAVTCRVAGRADARDLVIWVPLPAGSEAVEAKDAQRVSPGGRRMLRWPLGAAVPGDVVTRTCVLALPDSLEAGEHVLDFTPGADATGVDLVYASPVHARVRAAPVLGVTAALDPPVALPGESVSLSLVLANTGDAPARRLVLACDLPGGERRWAVDDLAPGATEEAVVPFDAPTDLPPGTHELAIGASLASSDLASSASSGGPDDFVWRVEAPVRLVVAALPRLQITAACDRHSAAPGDPVTWSLTVKNVGHAPALGVVVTDRLPERGRFLEAASGGEWHAEQACVVWALGDLAPEDQGRVLTWRAAIADTIPAGNHVFAHAPSVVADGTGSEPIVSGVTEVAVEAWPQLAVSLEVTDADGKPLQGPLEAGDLARVRARLVNSGPAAAVPATLSLELPPALRLAEGDSQWVVAELASGESAEQLLSVQVGSVLPVGLTSHLMRLTAATPDIADVQARVGISVRAAAQLEVAASCVRPLVGPGDEVEVVVAYSVSGTAHADGLVVSLTLPARVHLVEALDGGEGPTDPRARDIRWTPGQRAVGDTGQLRARLRLDKGLANDFVLPISVAARADGVDPVVGEVLELRVRAVPRLSLDLHSEQSTIRPGERIRYVLTVANSGRAPAADILVTNPLPPGLALENATHGGHYDDLADAVVWRLPLLAQG